MSYLRLFKIFIPIILCLVCICCSKSVVVTTEFGVENKYVPSLPIKYAHNFANEYGISFLTRSYEWDFAWSYFEKGQKDYIIIAKFESKVKKYKIDEPVMTYKLISIDTLSYDKSIQWSRQFNLETYKEEIGKLGPLNVGLRKTFTVSPNLYRTQIAYYLKTNTGLTEVNLMLNSNEPDQDPTNKSFYQNLEQDMVKYKIVPSFDYMKRRYEIPIFSDFDDDR